MKSTLILESNIVNNRHDWQALLQRPKPYIRMLSLPHSVPAVCIQLAWAQSRPGSGLFVLVRDFLVDQAWNNDLIGSETNADRIREPQNIRCRVLPGALPKCPLSR